MGETGRQLARQATAGADIVRVGAYRVRLSTREVSCGEQRIRLPWRSFEALRILIEAGGEVVERDTFFARLWPGVTVGESSLNHCIAKLRKELGEPPEGRLIATVARRGYRLTEAPEIVAEAVEDHGMVKEPASRPTAAPHRPLRRTIILLATAAVVLACIVVAYSWPRWSRRAQARTLTEQGFRQIRQNWVAGLVSANALFRQALELDPGQAAAYAGLAEVMARNVDASSDQAAVFAQRAVRLDPRCARCQAIAGWILMTRQWRFREGASYLERALALDRRDPQTLLWHAQMVACSGRLERALSEIEQARALDFKHPGVAAMRAAILYFSGRYDDAIQAGQEALGLKPDFSSAYEWIYRSQLHLQHVGEALAARAAMNASFVQLTPDSRFQEERRWQDAYRSGGLPKVVETLLAGSDTKPALDQHRYERATWKMWNGDRQGALDELEHVFDFRPFNTIYAAVDPTFTTLHREKRFRDLISRIGLDTLPARGASGEGRITSN